MHVYLHEGSMLHSNYYMFHINHYSNYYSGWSRQFRDPVLFRDGGTLTGPVHRDVVGGRGQPFMMGVNAGGPGTVSVPAKDYSHPPILCNLCPWPCPLLLFLSFKNTPVCLRQISVHVHSTPALFCIWPLSAGPHRENWEHWFHCQVMSRR